MCVNFYVSNKRKKCNKTTLLHFKICMFLLRRQFSMRVLNTVETNVSWVKHRNKEECIQPQKKNNKYVKIRNSMKIFFVFVCWTHKLRGIDELYKKKNTRTGNKKKHTISISSEVHVQTIYPLRSWSFPSFSPSVPITFLSAPTNNDKYINI